MATASPTPMPNGLVRRASQRQALRRPPSRQALTRSESQPVTTMAKNQTGQVQQYHDDSSEDEIPVPMKLSAFTKALLNDGAPEPVDGAPSPPRTRRRTSALNTSTSSTTEGGRHLRSGSVQAHGGRVSRPTSPARSREASPVRKRVVRLSNTPQSLNQIQPTKRRSSSLSRSTQRRPHSRSESRDHSSDEKAAEPRPDVNTPAQSIRVVRIPAGSSGNRSRLGSSGPSSGRSNADRSAIEKSGLDLNNDQPEAPETVARQAAPPTIGSVSRYPSTAARNRQEENANLQSSMRVKRVGKIPGSFLSGPARRGRRRQSEEDAENGDGELHIGSQDPESQPADEAMVSSFYADGIREFSSGSPVGGTAAARAIHRRQLSNADLRQASTKLSPKERYRDPEAEEIPYPKGLEARPAFIARHDQENEPPASFSGMKPAVDGMPEKMPKQPVVTEIPNVPRAHSSPERRPLAAMTNNTPHRPAPPPPPKMSIVDTATSAAGAAATGQAKQRRNVLRVNGKSYTRLDCLGRGGSAKVYRVAAENGKSFALKRVSLENADESTMRGFKGEIDLLTKLAGVDRVINLVDYELNDEKKLLTMVMEMGELDLNILMRERQNPEAARLDTAFVRFYWKEMLECLESVHQYDIVHSDLKPANFVLVRGKLKLIDFGIANAIQTDETVNVHRETQIGTPNYMSPESLLDANNPSGGRLAGRPKLMKLGKPSDVWSLGCILYQMVYGVPPFGHIANQMARCQAIINWDHTIEFPSRGVGGMLVPPSLLRTMRRCLNRDHHMRPTCSELLHETDPFLYPVELGDKALPMDEELLGRIIQSVVSRCRERMPTEAESVSVWPQAYWASVRKAMAGRM
ncbi:hypothetical protein S40285_00855 [Stachybotrys chlorohalonatus IBT 40285]|uniref:Protein kinase domain-containing protein n=1 Tax=Stachybotrys chlorohalonatus (strain IBT 40285) TaxID=1283841 RepID=A0A084QJN0_STAC4|nr:hypothetical protein S40285_00855 [Stachybotrys chlorohalonata IBT 40285]